MFWADGATFDWQMDGDRLKKQFHRVWALMYDRKWRTLEQIAAEVGGSEAGVSARLRDFRKERFGSHKVLRERMPGAEARKGLFVYKVIPRPTE